VESAELPDEEYPFTLVTGRMLYHYNAGAMTQRTEGLNVLASESYVEMNTADADAMGVKTGDKVRITSRRGEIETIAVVGDRVNPNEVFMTFHFEDGNANHLTNSVTDKIAKVPEFKVSAVKIEPAQAD
jgi:formate dehydrogenase major subunit